MKFINICFFTLSIFIASCCHSVSLVESSTRKADILFSDINAGIISSQFDAKYFPRNEVQIMISKLNDSLCFDYSKAKLLGCEILTPMVTNDKQEYIVLQYQFKLNCSDIVVKLRYTTKDLKLREFNLKSQ